MFDQTKDLDRSTLYQISKMVPDIPSYVKEASMASEGDVSKLLNTAFADERSRAYPLHTKASTWLSLAYFNKAASEQDDSSMDKEASHDRIREKFDTACAFWCINPATATLHIEKQASSGVTIEYRVGDDTKASTVCSTAAELLKVAEDMLQNTHKYPYCMRRDLGRQVLAAAPRLNATISGSMEDMLNKTSSYGVGDVSAVHNAIRQRQLALETYVPEIPQQLQELKQAVDASQQNGLVDPDMLDKVASVLDAVDRTQGLVVKYGRGLEPPERQICTTTMSQVNAFHKLAYKLPSGQHVAKDLLTSDITIEFVTDTLGQKFANFDDVDNLSYRNSEIIYDFCQDLEKRAMCGDMAEEEEAYDMDEMMGGHEHGMDTDEGGYQEGHEHGMMGGGMGGPMDISDILQKILPGVELPEEIEEGLEGQGGGGATIIIKQGTDTELDGTVRKDEKTKNMLDDAANNRPLTAEHDDAVPEEPV